MESAPGVHDGSVVWGLFSPLHFQSLGNYFPGAIRKKNKKGILKDKGYNMGGEIGNRTK